MKTQAQLTSSAASHNHSIAWVLWVSLGLNEQHRGLQVVEANPVFTQ